MHLPTQTVVINIKIQDMEKKSVLVLYCSLEGYPVLTIALDLYRL